MICAKCEKSEMYPKQVNKQVSVAGIVGVLIVLAGVATLLMSPVLGVLVVLTGVVISALGRGKNTFLVCPSCKHTINL